MVNSNSLGVGAVALSLCAALGACSGTNQTNDAEQQIREAARETAHGIRDAWITTKIQSNYFADEDVRGLAINVDTRDGVVSLTGIVDSPREEEQALAIARTTDGVVEVRNHLVRRNAEASAAPAGASDPITRVAGGFDSAWITANIQARYFADPIVKSSGIDVDTAGGIVTLSGHVESEPARSRAVEIARAVDGVREVDDRLVVGDLQPGGVERVLRDGEEVAERMDDFATDLGITTRLQSKFFLDRELRVSDIEVSTSDGVVTLQGQVASEGHRRRAMAIARNLSGVADVEDRLTVSRPADATAGATPATIGEDITDAWISTVILSKFYLDDALRRQDIDVAVRDGEVTLNGRVDTEAARTAALMLARETPGVVSVVDELRRET